MKTFILKHKKLGILFAVLLVFLVACSVPALRDYREREKVKAELVALEEHLVNEGIDPGYIMADEYCARSQTKSGAGAKYCSRRLNMIRSDLTLNEAQEYYLKFKLSVEKLNGVVILRGLPESLEKRSEGSKLIRDIVGYQLFSRDCTVDYRFGAKDGDRVRAITDETRATLSMSFGCNDDSWFLRNVLNNTIY